MFDEKSTIDKYWMSILFIFLGFCNKAKRSLLSLVYYLYLRRKGLMVNVLFQVTIVLATFMILLPSEFNYGDPCNVCDV